MKKYYSSFFNSNQTSQKSLKSEKSLAFKGFKRKEVKVSSEKLDDVNGDILLTKVNNYFMS